MSLSCLGYSRAWEGTGTGDLGGDSGTLLLLEEGTVCRLAGVGASGMCGNVWEGCCLLWPYDQVPTYFSHPVPSCPLLLAFQLVLAMLHPASGPLHMQNPLPEI